MRDEDVAKVLAESNYHMGPSLAAPLLPKSTFLADELRRDTSAEVALLKVKLAG